MGKRKRDPQQEIASAFLLGPYIGLRISRLIQGCDPISKLRFLEVWRDEVFNRTVAYQLGVLDRVERAARQKRSIEGGVPEAPRNASQVS